MTAAAIKIEKKITGYSVAADDKKPESVEPSVPKTDPVMESLVRPEVLVGATYKVKSPVIDSAMYITINDVIMNKGLPDEHRRPFEIFINSKNMNDFQWVVALTRVMSAVFRKGGDITFLVEELDSVFNPSGGYFKRGGKYMPSLVAEIGEVLRLHLTEIGMIEKETLDAHQQAFVDSKRSAAEKVEEDAPESSDFPPDATLCQKCKYKAVVVQGGCPTCLQCGDSKCS